MKTAVGIVIISRDTNKMLLLHRSTKPKVWSVLSGKVEEGEDLEEALKREIEEEIRINPDMITGIKQLGSNQFDKTRFHIFVGFSDHEFEIPNIKKDENDDYGWFTENDLPSPIHERWPFTFQMIKPILNIRENFKKGFNNLLNG